MTMGSVMPHDVLPTFLTQFEKLASEEPDREALVFETTQWTYARLNERSNQIAQRLLARGVQPEQRVGLCIGHSPDAIAAMIGIMKARAAFVPLETQAPISHVAAICDDASISLVVCQNELGLRLQKLGLEVVNLEAVDGDGTNRSSRPDFLELSDIPPSQLAYVMYTSGSTGKPKGVQIEQGALAAYCQADIATYELEPTDRTLQFSTLSFDIAIEEIFPPLLSGGCVVVRPQERMASPIELSAIVDKYQITAIHLATAYWHEWVDLMRAASVSVPKSLRLMVVTGEKVSAEHYRRWQQLCDHSVLWCNAYGPTEATVSATVFIPPPGWDEETMPIGKPLPGYTAWILDDQQRPVVGDNTGELYIGGHALARGYLNRAKQNKRAFPVLTVDGKRMRLYRTGDLARWLPDGEIEFGGRMDHQIKIGSYRIEPGQIEAAINEHPKVHQSVVIACGENGKKSLVAYVAHGQESLSCADVADFLSRRLPDYMRPARYLMLEAMPITRNGKIDRERLPNPKEAQAVRRQDAKQPRNALERQLCEIWSDVLQVPDVGVDDDFFALGGSSLLVTRVIAKIQSQLAYAVPVRDFFANPTIASIAAHLNHLETLDPSGDTAAGPFGPLSEVAIALRQRLPKLNARMISSGDDRLFGMHYPPVGPVADGRADALSGQPVRIQRTTRHSVLPNRDSVRKRAPNAVLICPPIGHEYQRSYRNIQQLAVQLSQAGCHVLRFDYSATGNSLSERPANVENWKRDVRSAANWLRLEVPGATISVVGLRLGATLAATSGLTDIERMVLWDPVSGADLLETLRRFHRAALRDFRRYNVRRRTSERGQLYGFDMPSALATQLELLPLKLNSKARNTTELMSSSVTAKLHCHAVTRQRATDEILWENDRFAESAFASADCFRQIRRLLDLS